MSTLYHTGLVIGLIVVYLLATFGVSIVATRFDEDAAYMVGAYVIGLLIFLFVTTQLLDAKGYWDLPQTQIIEEIETEVVE